MCIRDRFGAVLIEGATDQYGGADFKCTYVAQSASGCPGAEQRSIVWGCSAAPTNWERHISNADAIPAMKLSALLFRHRRWASPVATLLLVAVLAGLFALPYQYKFNQYQQGIRTLSPRIERMLGLMSVGSDMEQRQQAYAKALDVLAYPPQQNVEAMQNDLSTRLRQSVDGLSLIHI